MTQRRAPQLKSKYDVADFTATIIRSVWRGESDTEVARTMLYGLQLLNGFLTDAEKEKSAKEAQELFGSWPGAGLGDD